MQPEILHRLLGLREAARDRAGRALAEARKAEDRAREQLETLARYREVYAGQRTGAGAEGVSVAVLRNHTDFAKQLDGAFATARVRVLTATADVAAKSATWCAEERALLAYETLSKRQTAAVAEASAHAAQRDADTRTNTVVARVRQQQRNAGGDS